MTARDRDGEDWRDVLRYNKFLGLNFQPDRQPPERAIFRVIEDRPVLLPAPAKKNI